MRPRRIISIREANPKMIDRVTGQDDEEKTAILRLIIQTLRDYGYGESADLLQSESGLTAENKAAEQFRGAIIEGNYDLAYEALDRLLGKDTPVMMDIGRDISFEIEREKYIEYLEERKLTEALSSLRSGFRDTCHDPKVIRELAGLMVYINRPDLLHEFANWHGKGPHSRFALLQRIQQHLPSKLIIEPFRLNQLIKQALAYQISQCKGHYLPKNDTIAMSNGILTDHYCSEGNYSFDLIQKFTLHNDEVLHAAFSHDGTLLATASRDRTVKLWRMPEGEMIQNLEHSSDVQHVSWSPDDLQILTCCLDSRARLWDVKDGKCAHIFLFNSEVFVGTWTKDGTAVIVASQDGNITRFSRDGKTSIRKFLRITDISTFPNGLIGVIDNHSHLLILDSENLNIKSQSSFLADDESTPHTMTLSKDGSNIILSSYDGGYFGAFKLEGDTYKETFDLKYSGYYDGSFNVRCLLRGCFAREDEGLVILPNEYGTISIYLRGETSPIEESREHKARVNTVVFTPFHGGLLATASDDGTVGLWKFRLHE